ncbi:site-specific integrase [Halanaerocella petrolearia]
MGNRVEPIRDRNKIKEIKRMLKENNKYRDYVLFVCGVNFGLRISDLLKLKIKDITNLDGAVRETFEIIEQKTGKRNVIKINQEAKKSIQVLSKNTSMMTNRNNYLIYNTRAKTKGISRVQAYKLVCKWCQQVGLVDVRVGTHTLRKTWGYHAHRQGISIETIQEKYKHASTSTTRHYLGIEQKDVNKAYDKVNL